MNAAAKSFIGEKDFTSVRAAGCQAKTAIRNLIDLRVYRSNDWVWFDVTANAFLQHMVRNIAGMLMTVGYEDETVSWVEKVLLAKDRTVAGITAPPNGLYLTEVEYPNKFNINKPHAKPVFWE